MLFLFFALIITGLWLLLQRSITKMIIGLILIGNSVNLSIFFASQPEINKPAFITGKALTESSSNDPVPQALVLTAIVIGFAFVSFSVAMGKQLRKHGVSDVTLLEEEQP